MSHEIDMSTGKAGMAFVGETPWHGLGEKLEPGMPIEKWLVSAGMDWQILPATPQYLSPLHGLKSVEDKKVLYRSDNGEFLSIVSDKYNIVQPFEVLEFYRDLVGEAGFELETAGCLKGGRKFWALARTGEKGEVGKGDEMRGYLLLATSCDGTLATIAQFTSIRVVCNNTLQISLKSDKEGRVKKSHRCVFDAMQIKSELGLISESWGEFINQARLMAVTPVDKGMVKKFLIDVFDGDMEKTFEEQKGKRGMQKVYELMLDSPGSEMAGRSVWGLVNGLTRFVDFERKASGQENRLDNAWFGLGADLKEKGWASALELVGE